MPRPRKQPPPKMPTLQELASGLSCCVQTVKNRAKQGMPLTSVADAIAWCEAEEGRGVRTDRGAEPLPADLREAKIAAEIKRIQESERKLKLQNDLSEGRLVDVEIVERILAGMVLDMRTQFEGIAERLRPRLPPDLADDVVEDVGNLIRGELTRFSEWRPQWVEAADDEEIVEHE